MPRPGVEDGRGRACRRGDPRVPPSPSRAATDRASSGDVTTQARRPRLRDRPGRGRSGGQRRVPRPNPPRVPPPKRPAGSEGALARDTSLPRRNAGAREEEGIMRIRRILGLALAAATLAGTSAVGIVSASSPTITSDECTAAGRQVTSRPYANFTGSAGVMPRSPHEASAGPGAGGVRAERGSGRTGACPRRRQPDRRPHHGLQARGVRPGTPACGHRTPPRRPRPSRHPL